MISTADQNLAGKDAIDEILLGNFQLPETDKPFPCPIQSLVIEPSLDGHEGDLLENIELPRSAAIVFDANTYDALGKRLAKALPKAKPIPIEFPKADDATVQQLLDRARHAEALIAVGSGTLNDVVKFASHKSGRPYAVFATAPSMNGYVTATASITRHREKTSLPARPPRGAFFDLSILSKAPSRLVKAGVGDSLCRSTAEIDWMLSHQLLDTAFLTAPFAIQAKDEADLLKHVDGLQSGDLDAMNVLVRLLVLGGLGMLIAGSSQPGSQGEHLISHYIDMLQHPHPGSLHGEQVGLATRAMAALQHDVMSRSIPPVLCETRIDAAAMAKRVGTLSTSLEASMTKKAIWGERLEAMNRRLAERWPALQGIYKSTAVPLERLLNAFDLAGVAAAPEDLGISSSFFAEAILHARELRDRFTMLDLAADSGLLVPFAEAFPSKRQ